MAHVCNAVVERIGREQTQLDLNSQDGMYGMGFADRVRANLTQADAADLALLDQCGQGLDRGLDGDVGVDPRTFEDVDGFDAVQHLDGPLDGRTDSFRTAIRSSFHVVGALDAKHDLAGVLRIFLEVVFDQMQRVCLRRAVVYALYASQSGSPGWSQFDECLGQIEGSSNTLTPFQKLAPCSSAVFITFTASG